MCVHSHKIIMKPYTLPGLCIVRYMAYIQTSIPFSHAHNIFTESVKIWYLIYQQEFIDIHVCVSTPLYTYMLM